MFKNALNTQSTTRVKNHSSQVYSPFVYMIFLSFDSP